MVTAFHHHDCNEATDNCVICNFQHSFSSVVIKPANTVTLQQSLSESLIPHNERVADPSLKLVCYSHAPPIYFI